MTLIYTLFIGIVFRKFKPKSLCWLICDYINRIYVSLYTQSVLRVRKRVTLMVVTVTAIFGICWVPDIIAHLIDHFTSVSISEAAYAVIHMMVLFSSAINPFMYALVNKTFQEKLMGIIRCSCIGSTGCTRNRVFPPNETYKIGISSWMIKMSKAFLLLMLC